MCTKTVSSRLEKRITNKLKQMERTQTGPICIRMPLNQNEAAALTTGRLQPEVMVMSTKAPVNMPMSPPPLKKGEVVWYEKNYDEVMLLNEAGIKYELWATHLVPYRAGMLRSVIATRNTYSYAYIPIAAM